MTEKQARGMLRFHEAAARAYRTVGDERNAQAAERRAAECQAILQVARVADSYAPTKAYAVMYGWAENRGYGYCHECKPDDRSVVAYTPEREETCERCNRAISTVLHPFNATEGIHETTVCRIF